MKDIQDYLEKGNIEATLSNSRGEAWYLGPATTVRPLKNKHHFRFDIAGTMENISPFTKIILHSRRKLIDVVEIKPFYQEGRSVISLDYGRT